MSRTFYTTVTEAVLLSGADTWVLTPRMEKALYSFQAEVARKITGRQPRRKKDRSWEYPLLAGALREAGMVSIQTRPILDLCEQVTRRPGARVYYWWWKQAGIYL